jgi:radical SAM protein with 4Fe4S-binding SPASM domain
MAAQAAELGLGFRVDSAIFPCLPDHGHEPLDLRVEPRRAVEIEMRDPARAAAWTDYVDRHEGQQPDETLYRCGAGVTNFYVDPFGHASPCLMTTHHRHRIGEERSFADLWGRELEQIRHIQPRADYGCGSCSMRAACTGCPAFNYLENGDEQEKSEYVCETTRHRWQAIEDFRSRRGSPLLPVLPASATAGRPWQKSAERHGPARGAQSRPACACDSSDEPHRDVREPAP